MDTISKKDDTDYVAARLTEWGFEEYIEIFQREEIDKETFLTMPAQAVSELFTRVGPKYKFLKKWMALKKTEHSEPITDEQNTDDAENSTHDESFETLVAVPARSIVKPVTGHGEKLHALLLKSVNGKYLLSQKNNLTNADRSKLATIIVDYLLQKSFNLKTEQFNFWKKEIVSIFPNESEEIYYVPYKGGEGKHPASGKLWDKYTNTKKKLKSAFPLLPKAEELPTNTADDDDLLMQLQCVSLDDDATIKELWKKSYLARKKNIEISEYFDTFKVLSSPLGSTLLQLDFEQMNVVSDINAFLKNWPSLSTGIIHLAAQKANCKNILQTTEGLQAEIKALRILPYLFPPKILKTGKGSWKPSLLEQSKGFILWINTIEELDNELTKRQDLLHKFKLPFQPIIVAVGSPEQLDGSYVVINSVKYSFNSLLAAVDFCFKCFYALDAKYSVETETIWIFIEKAVYGMKGSAKKEFVSVNCLLSNLKTLENSAELTNA